MSTMVRVFFVLVAAIETMGCSGTQMTSNTVQYAPTTTYNPVTYRPSAAGNPYVVDQPVYSRFYSQGAYAGTSQPFIPGSMVY